MSTRIALITDIHVGEHQLDESGPTLQRFARAIEAINAAQMDFVLAGGDMVEHCQVDEMQKFAEYAGRFNARYRAIPGNHDVGNRKLPGREGEKDEVTSERVALYEGYFGPSFWREEVNGAVRVLAVNASLFGSGLPREAEQWQWLEAEVNSPSSLTTLLATHYPLYLETPDETDEAIWSVNLYKPYWNIAPQARQRLFGHIKTANIKAVLSGHLHHPLRHERDGILYVSSPPMTFAISRPQPPGEKSWKGWTLVEVADDGTVDAQWQEIKDS